MEGFGEVLKLAQAGCITRTQIKAANLKITKSAGSFLPGNFASSYFCSTEVLSPSLFAALILKTCMFHAAKSSEGMSKSTPVANLSPCMLLFVCLFVCSEKTWKTDPQSPT